MGLGDKFQVKAKVEDTQIPLGNGQLKDSHNTDFQYVIFISIPLRVASNLVLYCNSVTRSCAAVVWY